MGDYATVFSEDRGFDNAGVGMDSTNSSEKVYSGGTKALHYRVKSSRPEVSNIITDVLSNENGLKGIWEELPPGLGTLLLFHSIVVLIVD